MLFSFCYCFVFVPFIRAVTNFFANAQDSTITGVKEKLCKSVTRNFLGIVN